MVMQAVQQSTLEAHKVLVEVVVLAALAQVQLETQEMAATVEHRLLHSLLGHPQQELV